MKSRPWSVKCQGGYVFDQRHVIPRFWHCASTPAKDSPSQHNLPFTKSSLNNNFKRNCFLTAYNWNIIIVKCYIHVMQHGKGALLVSPGLLQGTRTVLIPLLKPGSAELWGGILTLSLRSRPVFSLLNYCRVYCSEGLFVPSELWTASQCDEKAKAREARHFQLAGTMAGWGHLFSASRSSECQTSREVFTTAHCTWNKLIWMESAGINGLRNRLKIINFQAKC